MLLRRGGPSFFRTFVSRAERMEEAGQRGPTEGVRLQSIRGVMTVRVARDSL